MVQRETLFSYIHRRQELRLLRDTDTGCVSWLLVPESLSDRALPGKTCGSDSIVQLHCSGDRLPWAFASGRTMRGGESTARLRYARHTLTREDSGSLLRVELTDERGYAVDCCLRFRDAYDAIEAWTEFTNHSAGTVTLEMLSSFSLGFLTPFEDGISRENLYLHRFRSTWAKEGMHERVLLEELQLEPSATNASANSLRFGTLGSMPVREFFPVVAVEDAKNNCFWACRLAHPCSWQMEAYRKDEALCLSGGIADYEFGHWCKHIAPEETFRTPSAYLAACTGSVDDALLGITEIQEAFLPVIPAEENLAIQYADWCTTWGRPTLDSVRQEVEALKDRGIEIFEIDAGWYVDDVGDWNEKRGWYPNGIRELSGLLRENGFIPGIWFEFENCVPNSSFFREHPDWLLTRDGHILQTARTAFLDMRKPEVQAYLTRKVTDFLKDNDFGYTKVDYNDTIGLGCDGAESLGEGLRQNMMASQDFFRSMRQAIPDLIIEICASGGHRLEPSMMALGSVASFSDAHETVENPIIAAELQRLILPRTYLVWVVLRRHFSEARTMFALAAGFLGRFLLSGDVVDIEPWQDALLDRSIALYHRVKPIIKRGCSVIHNHRGKSWREPTGYQAVVRTAKDGSGTLVVVHTFEGFSGQIRLPLANGGILTETLGTSQASARTEGHTLIIDGLAEFDGFVAHICPEK